MSTNNFNSIRLLPNYDQVTLNRKVASKGEVFYDPQTVSIRVFDGMVSGGHQILRADLTNLAGTIPATAFAAGSITNTKLQHSTVILGTTNIALGDTVGTLVGLTSVGSAQFNGPLTGDVTGNVTGN